MKILIIGAGVLGSVVSVIGSVLDVGVLGSVLSNGGVDGSVTPVPTPDIMIISLPPVITSACTSEPPNINNIPETVTKLKIFPFDIFSLLFKTSH